MNISKPSALSYARSLARAAALGCATAALSCAHESSPPPAPDAPAGGETVGAAGDDAFGERFHPSLAFAPCAEDPAFECGTLDVPADYDEPGAGRLALAVARARAKGPGERLGSLFINIGGPGNTGVDLVLLLADTWLAPLRERFDIVSFDPRGVGASEPALRCDFERPPAPAPGDSAARAAHLDEHAKRFADACLAQTGAVAAELTTNNVARDVDLLRAALGEKAISFHGVSYGAELGAAYASLFPKRVRAMVLDGGLPANFRDYTIEAFTEEAAAHELALERLDRLCRADPACPLRGVGLVAAVDELLARLRATPATSADGSLVLGEREAAVHLIILLQSDRTRWGRLPGEVAAALAGNYEPFFRFVGPPPAGLDPFDQVYAATFCNDFGARRPAADFLPLLEAAEALYPRVGKYAELELLLRTCQAWPAADPPAFRNVAGKLKTPILFVGNGFDPATPINWTRNLARALGFETSVLRYQGGGHTATSLGLRGVPCVDEAARRYLIDLVTPAEGAACPALPVTFLPPPERLE